MTTLGDAAASSATTFQTPAIVVIGHGLRLSRRPRLVRDRSAGSDLGDGLIVAAPHSGSGKTLLTLGLLAPLAGARLCVAPAKTGPDYIDTAFHARDAAPCLNLDPWAMAPARLGPGRGAGGTMPICCWSRA